MKILKYIPLSLALSLSLSSVKAEPTLLDKRKDHKTELIEKKTDAEPPPSPPSEIFSLIKYPSKVGELTAYLSKPVVNGKPAPAIIWLTGGFPVSNSGANLWDETSVSNEQSARIYRIKGIGMMFPHLRGRSGNPGHIENLYGEVDDVISAFNFLSKQKHIDPKRIYLGGHSTGGTLALLVAAATDKFAGVISLGPTDTNYGKDGMVYKWNTMEQNLRAPIRHLASIKSPTIVAEGETGNSDSLLKLKKANKNPLVKFTTVDQASHFSLIHPFNLLVAEAILKSNDGSLDLQIPALKSSYSDYQNQQREATDLENLSELRGSGVVLIVPQTITFYAYSEKSMADSIQVKLTKQGFSYSKSKKIEPANGSPYFVHRFTQRITPTDLKKLWKASAAAEELCNAEKLEYGSWSIEQK